MLYRATRLWLSFLACKSAFWSKVSYWIETLFDESLGLGDIQPIYVIRIVKPELIYGTQVGSVLFYMADNQDLGAHEVVQEIDPNNHRIEEEQSTYGLGMDIEANGFTELSDDLSESFSAEESDLEHAGDEHESIYSEEEDHPTSDADEAHGEDGRDEERASEEISVEEENADLHEDVQRKGGHVHIDTEVLDDPELYGLRRSVRQTV